MSFCTSEADDSMDTDSSASQGQVMSINGVHAFEQPETFTGRRIDDPQNSATSRGDGERRVSQEDKKLKRKRKWSGQNESLEFPVASARNISPVTEFPDQGQPTALRGASEATGKRQKANRSSPQQNRVGPSIASQANRNEMLYGLTPLLWQQIFSYVPPVFLGRLLRVSRKFHHLLTRSNEEDSRLEHMPYTGQMLMPGRSIWTASRQRFAPGLPKPLIGQDELDMWRLLRGNDCQRCGQRKSLMTIGNDLDAWHSGPGGNGVRVIWPFAIRSCGTCLVDQCEKEVSLLCSSTFPSFLLQALPCIFLTQFNECVSPSNLKTGLPPVDIHITKYFFKSHLKEIETRFTEVKDLGSGPVEEWIKGLDAEKRNSMQDATRWEQWESKGGLKKVNQRPSARLGPSQKHTATTAALPISSRPTTHSSQPTRARLFEFAAAAYDANGSQVQHSSSPEYFFNNAHSNPGFIPTSQDVQSNVPSGRPGRSIHDVNEAKAARRADIEKRCLDLDPPIPPSVLIHMESFQAALQISTPLTERAWEILKPRLLVQREEAEAREAVISEHARTIQQTIGDHESHLKDSNDASDREWELAQAPMREILAADADAIIAERWAAGAIVTKDNAPVFAADVLLSSRATFCGGISSGGPRYDQSEMQQLQLSHRKLTLETMKWLYDQKIKPLTEHFQRELFLCNGCEANSKFYGFEAVIQHYAAKHTSSLSLGNIVVNWRAEWPDEPPFHPSPRLVNGTSHSANVYANDDIRAPLHQTFRSQANAMYAENNPLSEPMVSAASPAFGLAGYPSTSYAHSTPSQPFGEPFVPNGEYHPPYFNQEYQGYAIQPAPNAGQALDQQTYPNEASVPPSGTGLGFVPASASGHLAVANDNLNTFARNGYPLPVGATDLYHTQLNEMAKHARDVWFGTSGIKDMPQSVRIYVVVQHVVCRFEQKYTNEPSISMFIDGLNHNALMRPVRSLNGLVCKTCAIATNAGADNIPHAQASTTERKLFTLPLLLNHFRSVHVENSRPTVDLQTGMESSKLDWKYDMIELPDTNLITNLMSAPGIDDKKLHLIAWVFPGLFPDPLPKLDSRTNSFTMRRSELPHQTYPYRGKAPDFESTSSKTFAPRTTRPLGDQQPPTSADDRPSPSSRGTEPPGDDEYDPHRPAYLGRIIESHPLHQSSFPHSPQGYLGLSTARRGNNTAHQRTVREESARHHGQGAYGDLLLRHQDNSNKFAVFHEEATERDPPRHAERLQSTHAVPEETSTPPQLNNPQIHRADVAAADRFLHDLGTTEMYGRRQNTDHTGNSLVSEAEMHHLYSGRPIPTSDKRAIRTASSLEREPTGSHPSQDVPTHRGIPGGYTRIGADATNEWGDVFNNHPVQYIYSTVRDASYQGAPETQRDPRSGQISYLADSGVQTMQSFELPTEGRHRLDSRAYRPISPEVRTVRYAANHYEGSDLEHHGRQLDSYGNDSLERFGMRDEYDPGKVEYIYASNGQSSLVYPGTLQERRVEYIPVVERTTGGAASPVFVASQAFDSQSSWNRSGQEASRQRYGQADQHFYQRADQHHSPIPESSMYSNRRGYEYLGD